MINYNYFKILILIFLFNINNIYSICGDGIIDEGLLEECDLGEGNSNDISTSGCNEHCKIKDGFTCTSEIIPLDALYTELEKLDNDIGTLIDCLTSSTNCECNNFNNTTLNYILQRNTGHYAKHDICSNNSTNICYNSTNNILEVIINNRPYSLYCKSIFNKLPDDRIITNKVKPKCVPQFAHDYAKIVQEAANKWPDAAFNTRSTYYEWYEEIVLVNPILLDTPLTSPSECEFCDGLSNPLCFLGMQGRSECHPGNRFFPFCEIMASLILDASQEVKYCNPADPTDCTETLGPCPSSPSRDWATMECL